MTRSYAITFFLALSLWGIAAGPASSQASGGEEVPDVLYHDLYEEPVWVSAHATLDTSGRIRAGLFREDWIRAVERVVESDPQSDCLEVSAPVDIDAEPVGGRPELALIAESPSIMKTKVVGRVGGFYFGQAGTLLRLRPVEVVAGEAQWQDRYMFVPSGQFEVGEVSVCARAEGFPIPPDLGTELVQVVPRWQEVSSGAPFAAGPENLFVLEQDGSVAIHPDLVRRHPGLEQGDLKSLQRWIESVRARGGTR